MSYRELPAGTCAPNAPGFGAEETSIAFRFIPNARARPGVQVIVKKRRRLASEDGAEDTASQEAGETDGRRTPRVFVLNGKAASLATGPMSGAVEGSGVCEQARTLSPETRRRTRRAADHLRSPGRVTTTCFETAPLPGPASSDERSKRPGDDWLGLRLQLQEIGGILRAAQAARRFRI